MLIICRETQEQVGRYDPRSFVGHDRSKTRAGVYGSQGEDSQIKFVLFSLLF